MYRAFFGLREPPFQLTPNPRFLFLNPEHREALATLRYGLASSPGITLLLGEAGTGKTTLLRAALRAEKHSEHRHLVFNNPRLTPAEFFAILAERLHLPDMAGSKGRFLLAFEQDLLRRHAAGGQTALVIDEAQSLSHDLFEEIRLLANLETETAKLVNVVLVGQPELAERLNERALRQFKQRVVLRCALTPLDLESTACYIATRLKLGGAIPAEVFTKDAVTTIFDASGGIPRTIGVLCENALLAGFAAQKKPVDRSIVLNVCRDLDLTGSRNGHRSDNGSGNGTATFGQPREDTSVAEPSAPEEPRRFRAISRGWFSSRRKQLPVESSEETPQAAPAADRRRIFRIS